MLQPQIQTLKNYNCEEKGKEHLPVTMFTVHCFIFRENNAQ